MKSLKWALLGALLIWFIPFVISLVLFPIHTTQRPLFESIMPVVLAVCASVLGNLYFRRLDNSFVREGVWLGLLWLLVSIALDLLMFMWGPMKMSLADYVKDIGFTYLIYPAITIGMGYLLVGRQTMAPVQR
ncbi:MAG: hypothetical protein U0350_34510 [Caldilineaceae bacterium]